MQIASLRNSWQKKRDFCFVVGKMPSQRRGKIDRPFIDLVRDRAVPRIVEYDGEFAFVLAGEFAAFQRPRFGGRLPVDMAARVHRSIFPDATEVDTAP